MTITTTMTTMKFSERKNQFQMKNARQRTKTTIVTRVMTMITMKSNRNQPNLKSIHRQQLEIWTSSPLNSVSFVINASKSSEIQLDFKHISILRVLTEEKDNRLVECHECTLKYHQKCHKPPVSTADISDPRCLWYCSKCRKALNKRVSITND